MNTTPWLHPGIAPSGKPFAPLRGSALRFVATLVIFLATLGTTSRAIAQQQTPDSNLTYSELIEKIEQDQVRRIVFDQTTRKAHVFLRDQENPELS